MRRPSSFSFQEARRCPGLPRPISWQSRRWKLVREHSWHGSSRRSQPSWEACGSSEKQRTSPIHRTLGTDSSRSLVRSLRHSRVRAVDTGSKFRMLQRSVKFRHRLIVEEQLRLTTSFGPQSEVLVRSVVEGPGQHEREGRFVPWGGPNLVRERSSRVAHASGGALQVWVRRFASEFFRSTDNL